MTGIRALTILFALALLWAAAVAVMLVGHTDLPGPRPEVRCPEHRIVSRHGCLAGCRRQVVMATPPQRPFGQNRSGACRRHPLPDGR